MPLHNTPTLSLLSLSPIQLHLPTSSMADDFQDYHYNYYGQVQGGGGELRFGGIITSWFPKLIDTQVDLIANTFSSLTSNPNPKPEPEVWPAAGHHLLRRLGYGILGAVYAGMVLAMVMMAAAILGVLVVNYWVEEPVVMREKLNFDFTELNPKAAFVFGGGGMGGERKSEQYDGVPLGHTFYVSVELLVPDSDYNRDIGLFQIMAEVISTNGKTVASSSRPSMLQYRSHPIRLMHTFMMGFPLLLGLTRETQTITVPMLKYKEDSHLRTEAIRITLLPRAGTPYLPQLYEAGILMHSRLPWMKRLVHNWKWTLYVWTSLHIYAMLLGLILCFFRPLLVFPVLKEVPGVGDYRLGERESGVRMPEQREFTETLRKWQHYRKKRKAELLSKSSVFMESISASGYTVNKEDTGPGVEEDVGDSESFCLDS